MLMMICQKTFFLHVGEEAKNTIFSAATGNVQ